MASLALLQPEVGRKLRRLRAALRARLAAEALAWMTLALVALVFVTLAFDYLLRMDRPQRGIVMAVALAAVGWVAWRRLIAPLLAPMRWEDLALLVERRYVQLDDRLISAIQFARPGAAAGASGAMVARVVREANEIALSLQFGRIVERRELLRAVAAAGCAAALLAGFCLWQGELMGLWFARNVAFAEAPWPQQTYLAVQGGPDFSVLRGDDLKVVVSAGPGSVAPPTVTLHARYPSVGDAQEQVAAAADGRTYQVLFRAVTEPFEFHVTGGDDERDARRRHKVTVIDPPELRELHFSLEYPPHMNRPVGRFEGGRGALGAWAGSTVNIVAVANKDLRSAAMLLNDEQAGTTRIEPVGLAGLPGQAPRGIIGRFEITGKSRAEALTLRFALTDTDGHTNRRGVQYLIQVQPDTPPVVIAARRGVGATVTPNAVLPLAIQAKDDCGVASVRVLPNIADRKDQPAPAAVKLPEAATAGAREIKLEHELDLAPYELKPGQVVGVRVEATDALPPALGGPNTAGAEPLVFRLVSPEELMEELVRRQKELRLEFVEAVSLQDSARAKSAAAEAALANAPVTPDVRRQLRESARTQRGVAAQCAKAADTLSAILTEMRCNRLGTDEDQRRLTDAIIRPLGGLAEPMSRTVAAIAATEAIDGPEDLRKQAEQIALVQQDFLRQMETILQNMQKLQDRQELANQLRILIKWSEELLRGIEEKQVEEAKGIFQPASQPKPMENE